MPPLPAARPYRYLLGDGRPPFTKAQAAALTHAWQAAARTRHALLISPAVIDVVGPKA